MPLLSTYTDPPMRTKPLLALALLLPFAAAAQLPVDSAGTCRTALLELFTGVQGINCPLGDMAADAVCAAHPGQALCVSVHSGAYATLYATPEGDSIAALAHPQGYPSATVNRIPGQDGAMTLSQADWESAVAGITNRRSFVNIAAEAEVESASRLLTVTVQLHFTTAPPASGVFLNVMLLQNNVMGPQIGGSAYPLLYNGGQYRHHHVLRTLLTPLWGDTVLDATQGTTLSRTYFLVLPQQIGDLPIGDNFGDLEVIAFVSQADREVVTATRAAMVTGHAAITGIAVEHTECSRLFIPYVTVSNLTRHPIGHLVLLSNGQTIVANKTIAPLQSDTVRLQPFTVTPDGDFPQLCTQSRTASLVQYTDRTTSQTVEPAADPVDIIFADFSLFPARGPLRLTLDLDAYPSETSLTVKRLSDCSPLISSTFGNAMADRSVSWILDPAAPGLYSIDLHDSRADGMCRPDRGLHLTDADSNEVLTILGDYGANATAWLNITNSGSGQCIGIGQTVKPNTIVTASPNPVSDWLTVHSEAKVLSLTLFDMAGRRVAAATSGRIDLSALPGGLYMLHAVTADGPCNIKVIKQ